MNETLTALIEAAKQADREVGMYGYVMQNTQEGIVTELRNSQLPLRASLARDKAIEAYVANLRHEGDLNGLVQRTVDEEVEGRLKGVIADELQSLLEGRK